MTLPFLLLLIFIEPVTAQAIAAWEIGIAAGAGGIAFILCAYAGYVLYDRNKDSKSSQMQGVTISQTGTTKPGAAATAPSGKAVVVPTGKTAGAAATASAGKVAVPTGKTAGAAATASSGKAAVSTGNAAGAAATASSGKAAVSTGKPASKELELSTSDKMKFRANVLVPSKEEEDDVPIVKKSLKKMSANF